MHQIKLYSTTPGPYRLHPTQRWLRAAAILALVASAGACSLFGGQESSGSDDSSNSPGYTSPGPTSGGSSSATCSAACSVDSDCTGSEVCYQFKDGTRACVPPDCPACSDAGHLCRYREDTCTLELCGDQICGIGCTSDADCTGGGSCSSNLAGDLMCLPSSCSSCYTQGKLCYMDPLTCAFQYCEGDEDPDNGGGNPPPSGSCGSCSSGEVCVTLPGGAQCTPTCSSNASCYSGCCAPTQGGPNVCLDASYCSSTGGGGGSSCHEMSSCIGGSLSELPTTGVCSSGLPFTGTFTNGCSNSVRCALCQPGETHCEHWTFGPGDTQGGWTTFLWCQSDGFTVTPYCWLDSDPTDTCKLP